MFQHMGKLLLAVEHTIQDPLLEFNRIVLAHFMTAITADTLAMVYARMAAILYGDDLHGTGIATGTACSALFFDNLRLERQTVFNQALQRFLKNTRHGSETGTAGHCGWQFKIRYAQCLSIEADELNFIRTSW